MQAVWRRNRDPMTCVILNGTIEDGTKNWAAGSTGGHFDNGENISRFSEHHANYCAQKISKRDWYQSNQHIITNTSGQMTSYSKTQFSTGILDHKMEKTTAKLRARKRMERGWGYVGLQVTTCNLGLCLFTVN